MNNTQRRIEQALSLRQPQKDSLDILAQILERIELKRIFHLKKHFVLFKKFILL